jgi:hypothetical protein
MTKLLNMHFAGAELMTGLPEYRNGGLLVDTGLLTLKKEDAARGLETYHKVTPADQAIEVVPTFEPSDDVIVEWRACTVGFLDELLTAVNKGLRLEGGSKLSLAQMLEAGTWKVCSVFGFALAVLIVYRVAERLPKFHDLSRKDRRLGSFQMELSSNALMICDVVMKFWWNGEWRTGSKSG